MIGLDLLLSVANITYLVSYTMRDILWLRILTVGGGLLLLPYYYLQPDPLWAPIAWNVVFIAINVFWITKLLLERRPIDFTDEERRLYTSTFGNLTERQAYKLFHLGSWSTQPEGTRFLTEGQPVDALTVIASGHVEVTSDGAVVDVLGEGRLLGATAFLMRGTTFTAPVTVTGSDATRIVSWPMETLDAAFSKDKDVEVAVEACLGVELSRFLQTARTHQLHPHLT